MLVPHQRNRNRKLEISTALTKVKSLELAYSQAPVTNKIDRQCVKSREIGSVSNPENQAGRQSVRRLWWMALGVETGREVGRRGQIRIGFVKGPVLILE